MAALRLSSSSKVAARGVVPRAAPSVLTRRVVARAQEEAQSITTTTEPTLQAVPVTASPAAAAPEPVEFQLLGATQEAINGRAAMLGMVAAILAESTTHHSVFSQLAGKYVDMELVEKPFAGSVLGFAAIVAIVSVASVAPRFIADVKLGERSFGPFTPFLETLLGRTAMMGFLGLLILEVAKGSSFL